MRAIPRLRPPRPSAYVHRPIARGGNGATSNVFAIGEIGFDFQTEARRDSFRQLMDDVFHGSPPVRVKANPYDVFQLADYLDAHRSESTS